MAPRLDALSILIVDDNQYMRALLATLLRAFGIERVPEAGDVNTALKELRTGSIDIVLTDLAMQPMDGIEFTKLLRRAGDSPAPFVPIVMITGHSDRPRVEAARDAGVSEFLVKPVTARALFDRLVAVIDAPRAFVRSSEFMGPDRRRRRTTGYQGPFRRTADRMGSAPAIELD
jgi:CheY-like chemotaxis protein